MSNRTAKNNYYRNANERHYCAVCNAWMGSDRQSILLHENGKKHREKVEEQLKEKRRSKQQEESQSKALQQQLQQMEAAAQSALPQDLAHFTSVTPSLASSTTTTAITPPMTYSSFVIPPPPPQLSPPPPPVRGQQPSKNSNTNSAAEKQEWRARKKQRFEEKQKKSIKAEDGSDDGDDEETQQTSDTAPGKANVPYEQGHYAVATEDSAKKRSITYLEGDIFGDILEEEMPIELWKGSPHATTAEQRLSHHASLWIPALVVRPPRSKQHDTTNKDVLVTYLNQETDDAVETTVPLSHIRIVLGNPDDERIPDTIAEARILAGYDGGGEILDSSEQAVDEATGLTAWTTVAVKRTTLRKELKEERERLREQRKQAALEHAQEERKKQVRIMEEAAVQSAGDSALGAYDIWNRGETDGYKGIDILQGTTRSTPTSGPSASDVLGKKLSDGKTVQFQSKKKSALQKRKQNRRRTSADD